MKEGLSLQLLMVGDGKHRSELEARAKALGLADRVIFLGQLQAGAQVHEQLDKADLFVLPSYQEGMPRAMLEAMARGLPCIGSTVGGIPELLPQEDMVPPGDAPALAEKIRDVLQDPERLSRMAKRNLEKAQRYSDQILHDKRVAFYQHVRDVTETWLSQQDLTLHDR
jgi:glycosyltransferase involved in cell wall biosynthesis